MSEGFYLYAEATHPEKKLTDITARRIDMLGISPSLGCYLACEFKNYIAQNMTDSQEDLDRVHTFALHGAPSLMVYRRKETLQSCTKGYGLVAGLTWVTGTNRAFDLTKSPDQRAFTEEVGELGGKVLEPIPIDLREDRGYYFLLSALLPCEINQQER